jgi:hypothetical protein
VFSIAIGQRFETEKIQKTYASPVKGKNAGLANSMDSLLCFQGRIFKLNSKLRSLERDKFLTAHSEKNLEYTSGKMNVDRQSLWILQNYINYFSFEEVSAQLKRYSIPSLTNSILVMKI